MNQDPEAENLLTETGEFLTELEASLHTASLDERVAVEQATEGMHGRYEGDTYNSLTTQIAALRDRIWDHLEN